MKAKTTDGQEFDLKQDLLDGLKDPTRWLSLSFTRARASSTRLFTAAESWSAARPPRAS